MGHRKDAGMLVLRLTVGGVIAAHGSQKLFGWFGGGGIDGTAQAMEGMGFTPGRTSALAAGLGETGGGTLLALGLGTPAAAGAAAATMATASSVHLPNGFFAVQGGLELPALLGAVATGIAVAGPGRYSLDHVLGHRLDRSWMLAAALAGAAVAATAVIGRRAALRAAAEADEGAADWEEDAAWEG